MQSEDSPSLLFMNTTMKKSILALTLLFIVSIQTFAQGVDDAITYSQTFYEGTGRSMAMGGATGAMGGDFTALCINPAGLGLYRSSEITFTTGIQHNLNTARYYGERHSKGLTKMSIPNFGYVLAMPCSNYKPLRYMHFALGLTCTNDHNYRSYFRGLNPSSSFIDSYLQTINGIDDLFNPFVDAGDYLNNNYPYDIHPAWQTYLIDQFEDSLGIYYDNPIPQGDVYQQNTVSSTGRSEEWTMAFSANLIDKVYIGASLGFAHIKRRSTRTYIENPGTTGSNNTFTEWSFEEELKDDAWGINAKFGLIYAPVHWLRLGATVHSNTLYSFDEVWYTTTKATLLDNHHEKYNQYYSPTLNNNYDFYTPASYTVSAAFIIGQHGMITTDAEYMNYGKSKLKSDLYSFSNANQDIKEILRPTFNLRLGTEWRVYQFFLRGGVAYYGSPFGFGDPYGSMKKLGFGIGYATHADTFWDFAYELSESTTAYTPYQYYIEGSNNVESAIQHRWRSKLVATLKIKM